MHVQLLAAHTSLPPAADPACILLPTACAVRAESSKSLVVSRLQNHSGLTLTAFIVTLAQRPLVCRFGAVPAASSQS